MAHDVFISYSSKDKPTADAVCAMLERHGVRCWIAPRDVVPGDDWAGSIIDAISEAKVFVLVFSSYANASAQVKREVERAANHELPIIPFRIENVAPDRTLEFFISTPHWLDAYSPPLDAHIRHLTAVVDQLVARRSQDVPPKPIPPLPPPPPDPRPGPSGVDIERVLTALRKVPARGWLGGAAAIVLVAGSVFLSNGSHKGAGAPDASAAPAATVRSAAASAGSPASSASTYSPITPVPAGADPAVWARSQMVGRWWNLGTHGCQPLNIQGQTLDFDVADHISDEVIDSISSTGEVDTHASSPPSRWSYVLELNGDNLTVTNRDSGEGGSYFRCKN